MRCSLRTGDAINLDNDAAAIRVSPLQLDVSEFGDSDTFEVVLVTQPLANVTIPITSSDTTEGTPNKSSLTFTTANWNVPQVVTVTGANDALIDGQLQFFIRTGPAQTTDAFYTGVDADVRGVDDPDPDGDPLVMVITQPCTSADPVYNLFDPRNIRVLNRDND